MTDSEILKYAKDFRNGMYGSKDGDGLCFAVAAPLCGILRFMGVECRLVQFQVNGFEKFEEHYAIIIENNLLDPTFDQIKDGNPKVYFGSIPDNYIEI